MDTNLDVATELWSEAEVTQNTPAVDKKALLDAIMGHVYIHYRRYGFDTVDDAAEALILFRTKLETLIENSARNGLPHDRYIDRGIEYIARTVRRQNYRAREKESVFEYAPLWNEQSRTVSSGLNEAVFQQAATQCVAPGKAIGSLGTKDRRLVFLLIKCALMVDDSVLHAAAQGTGVPLPVLSDLVERARLRMEGERIRVSEAVEQRNEAWVRLYALQIRLLKEEDPARRHKILESVDRQRRRFESALLRTCKAKPLVPNTIISELLDIPKGTIDSGLYYLRKQSGTVDTPEKE